MGKRRRQKTIVCATSAANEFSRSGVSIARMSPVGAPHEADTLRRR